MMQSTLHCKALVTGGNRGIGRAVCEQLARQGYQVVVAARQLGAATVVAQTLPNAQAIQLDIANDASVAHAAAQVGAVDILVNNGAILPDEGADLLTIDFATITEAVNINLLGAWRLCQAFVPGMVQRGWGRVVNVSSSAGSFGDGFWPAAPLYSVTKAGLNALTVLLAQEVQGSGVLVNAVCPGWTDTDMGKGGRPVAEGAKGVVWAATLPDTGPTGGFFRDGRVIGW